MEGRDWNANEDRDVLGRIVALLLALAGLADIAAGLPLLRRRRVLAVLACGEAAARTLFADIAQDSDSGEDPLAAKDVGCGNGFLVADDVRCGTEDAALLAARFRALAFVLAALLSVARLFAPSRAAFLPRCGCHAGRPDTRQLASPARRHDRPP